MSRSSRRHTEMAELSEDEDEEEPVQMTSESELFMF